MADVMRINVRTKCYGGGRMFLPGAQECPADAARALIAGGLAVADGGIEYGAKGGREVAAKRTGKAR